MQQSATQNLLQVALDLTASLSTPARYQRLISSVREVFACDASALLVLRDGWLEPVAVDGHLPGTMQRRFDLAEHPRLRTILTADGLVRFPADHPFPDPFDELLQAAKPNGDAAHVHSCMGAPLRIENELVGVLVMDALQPGMFDDVDEVTFATFAALAASAMRTATLIETLESLAERRGLVSQDLMREARARGGGIILGQSPAIEQLKDEIDTVAVSDLAVLITGETGTGKELVARVLHDRSHRADAPLVHVNCAALPESIAESELFGHEKGAFTGADATRLGKFELADGGTLFLDEIGELPMSIQPKLLRALQYGEIQRVGADRALSANARIVAATNRNLADAVRQGTFRADLYHRLAVYPIHVPPLRDRAEDIPLLTLKFLDDARVRLGIGSAALTPPAMTTLKRFGWPGNVRELEHVVLRAALKASTEPRTEGGKVVVGVQHLGLLGEAMPLRSASDDGAVSLYADLPLRDAVDAFQRDLLQRHLVQAGGNFSAAARELQIDRRNIHRLAKRLGLIEA